MIAAPFQGQGYGRAAMQEVLELLRDKPDCLEVVISYETDNTAAARLYASVGFCATGEIIDGEVVARLRLTP